MSKKKIMIPMSGFFPGRKYGGPPVSVDNFCSLLKEYEVFIVTTNHDIDELTPYDSVHDGWNDRGNCKVLYLPDNLYTYHTFKKIVNEVGPDCIYLQGLFQSCVLPILRLSIKYNIKDLLAPRGELCSGAFDKQYKKIPYIIFLRTMGLLRNTQFQSTSDEETKAIKKYLGVKDTNVHFLSNIPSIPKKEYVRDVKVSGMAKFIFLSRIVPKKNLKTALTFFNNIRGNVCFDIYGPKEDEKYWQECMTVISTLPRNVQVQYKGLVSHDMVHETFSKYDALVFPTFSENYGHVIAESLLSGCSVIVSDQTPWTDIQSSKCGWAIPLTKPKDFSKAIQCIVDMSDEQLISLRLKISGYLKLKMRLDLLKNAYKNAIENGLENV